jgi:hypothetical protein
VTQEELKIGMTIHFYCTFPECTRLLLESCKGKIAHSNAVVVHAWKATG